jgi:hypothetical protein
MRSDRARVARPGVRLNQVPRWAAPVPQRAIRRAPIRTPREPGRRIEAFVAAENATAAPFAGTVTRESVPAKPGRRHDDIREPPPERRRIARTAARPSGSAAPPATASEPISMASRRAFDRPPPHASSITVRSAVGRLFHLFQPYGEAPVLDSKRIRVATGT